VWGWTGIVLLAAALLYVLSPILAPFLFAGILAYILDPLVERLTGRYLPRSLAVVIVMLGLIALLCALLLVIVPLLYREIQMLTERLPGFLAWVDGRLAPKLSEKLGFELRLDVETLRQMATNAVPDSRELIGRLLGSLRLGGLALVALVANLLLVPVVLFYLLRDWQTLIARTDRLIPPRIRPRSHRILGEIDQVLAEFLRGQLLVILAMSVYYVAALWVAQLEFALPIGLVTGILVFVPYVGAAVGLVLATVAALMQFDGFSGLAWVWLVFAIGQALEGSVITPWLVGDRIGLHPVAAIFALLAFGQLFGFFGVLAALPASAALLVGLRHLREAYLSSPMYGRESR